MMRLDEILNMPAGREMDALVAVKVFGWTDFGIEYSPRFQKPSDNPGGVRVIYNLPTYSTDIASAWQVVEKMNKLDYEVIINSVNGTTTVHVCHKDWITDNLYQARALPGSSAPTAPLAICRAALFAIVEEV